MNTPARVPGPAWKITGPMTGHAEYSAARGPPSPALSSHRTSASSPAHTPNAPFPIQEIKHT